MPVKSLIAAVLGVFAAGIAHAEDMDMRKIACKEFVAAPKDQIAIILSWLEGFYTKESDPPVIFADKATKDAKNLNDYCNAHPDDNVIQAADAVMPVK